MIIKISQINHSTLNNTLNDTPISSDKPISSETPQNQSDLNSNQEPLNGFSKVLSTALKIPSFTFGIITRPLTYVATSILALTQIGVNSNSFSEDRMSEKKVLQLKKWKFSIADNRDENRAMAIVTIEDAYNNNSIYLNLSDLKLTELPDILNDPKFVKNLKSLDISGNSLKTFPKQVMKLTNLENLFIRNNLLEEIPPEVKKLENLKGFTFCGNPLDLKTKKEYIDFFTEKTKF